MERIVAAEVSEAHFVPNVSSFATLRRLGGASAESVGNVEAAQNQPKMKPASSTANILLSAAIKRKAAVDQLAVLLVQLGPASNFAKGKALSSRQTTQNSSSSATSSQKDTAKDAFGRANVGRAFQEFMKRQSMLPSRPAMIEQIEQQRIFYESGVSLENRPVFYYIARKVTPDTMDLDMLLHVIFDKSQHLFGKAFDLVVDLTYVSTEHEWPAEALHTLEKVVPAEARQSLHTLLFLHPNSYFKTMAKHAPRVIHSRMAKRVIFASSIAELSEYIARDKITLPKTTTSIYDAQMMSYTPTFAHLFKGSSIPVTLLLSSETLIIQMAKKHEVMGLQPPIVDIFRVSDIRDIGITNLDPKNADLEFFIKFHDNGNAGSVAYRNNTALIYLSSPKRDDILQAIRASVARFQLSRPAVTPNQRDVSPRDLPGTLLNIALLNMCSEDPSLRTASYGLLCAIVANFQFDAGTHLRSTKGLAIPINSHIFSHDISAKLAETEHALTFEFLAEALVGFQRLGPELKQHALNYMSPWLANLSQYLKPADAVATSLQMETAHGKVIQVLTSLMNLTLKEKESFFVIQNKIWSVLAKQELLLPVLIDLFMETSMQLAFGAPESEVLANTLITLASENAPIVAGTIIKHLRNALAATSNTPRLSIVDHPSWRTIRILLRYVLMLSFDNKIFLHQFLPDLFHSLSLVVGLGVPAIRRTVHAIVTNIIQVFLATTGTSETGIMGLQLALDKLYDPTYARMFGLFSGRSAMGFAPSKEPLRDTNTLAFVLNQDAVQGESLRETPLSDIEFFVSVLVDISNYGSPNMEINASWKTRWISLAAQSAFEDNHTAQIRSFIMIGSLARDGFDSDLLYQTITALRGSLSRFDDGRPQLVQSIVMCLCQTLHSAPATEQIIVPLFWLAIVLMQTGYSTFFQSGLNLLQVVLRLVEENPWMRGRRLTQVLIAGRDLFVEATSALENETRLFFGDLISFSIATTLLRGLISITFKKQTTAVFKMLLELSSGVSTEPVEPDFVADTLGYVIAMIPTAERPETILTLAGITEATSWDESPTIDRPVDRPVRSWAERVVDILPLHDRDTTLLSLVLFQVMLEASDFESEVLQIQRLLAVVANRAPSLFTPIYIRLNQRFANTILTTKSTLLNDSVHSIFDTMEKIPDSDIETGEPLVQVIERLGFTGIFTAL
eukprot:jgi/Hompol1/6388/HPOL_002062-RA